LHKQGKCLPRNLLRPNACTHSDTMWSGSQFTRGSNLECFSRLEGE
jgi:hypothetical protein